MAVGIFDSGLGGLTVLDAVARRLPDVPFVYFGDNAHAPYGVRDSEATAGRAAYTGKATLNPEISLSGIYRFDRHHSMMLNVGVKALGKEIKDSPIVDRSTENRVMLGYTYRF